MVPQTISEWKTYYITRNDNNENIVDPIEINESFKKIYKKLYSLEIGPNTSEINNFLDKIQIPKISEVIKGELEK